ncbi:hypothetical protein [Kordia jejudonensis]|uniref:hypothetical protein n=1 Tax=Kordia jejudonensis TaxID=1348245 RepID=UPI000629AF5B|nr:hypothetical protein [Kordia jejudonensis]
MKKKNLKQLNLNKKSISSFSTSKIQGGITPILTSFFHCDDIVTITISNPEPIPEPDTRRVCDESIKICV